MPVYPFGPVLRLMMQAGLMKLQDTTLHSKVGRVAGTHELGQCLLNQHLAFWNVVPSKSTHRIVQNPLVNAQFHVGSCVR